MLHPGADHPLRKECNWLEAMQAAIEHDPDEVWIEYRDAGRNPWETLVLPVLKQMPIDRLVAATGMHRRSLFAIRAGERRPHPRNQQALLAVAIEVLLGQGVIPPNDDLPAGVTVTGHRAK